MTDLFPSWALRRATPADRALVQRAQRSRTLRIKWPATDVLRAWARQNGWRAPLFGLQDAFWAQMVTSDENFALALNESGIELLVPIEKWSLPPETLAAMDAWYAERSSEGRPSQWDALVEEIREIRRAVEGGVSVEIEGRVYRQTISLLEWAHARYHMLEEGIDKWIGDDRS